MDPSNRGGRIQGSAKLSQWRRGLKIPVTSVLFFRTAFVAPEIVEAILEGRQPPDLTLASILGDVPLSWREQKKMMGLYVDEPIAQGT